MIKVLMIDDHHLFAEGVKSMFQPNDGMQVVAHTVNGNEAPAIIEALSIDVILMDVDMPILDGLSTMDLLKRKGINVPILMLTMHQSMKQIKGALEKGAQGYIIKAASKEELKRAITCVFRRENYFHDKISNQVFDYMRGAKTKTDNDILSHREKEIISCLAKGLNSKAIADQLYISENTVRTHRRNIMHKLQVNTSAELVRYAMEKGIIEV